MNHGDSTYIKQTNKEVSELQLTCRVDTGIMIRSRLLGSILGLEALINVIQTGENCFLKTVFSTDSEDNWPTDADDPTHFS